MRFTFALAMVASLSLSACGGAPAPADDNAIADNLEAMADAMTNIDAPAPATVAGGSAKHPVEACKAAIGAVMGRDPGTMKGRKLDATTMHVSYIRPDDGKRWQARCRIDGPDRLTWAQFDAFGDGQQGRWREEDTIRFTDDGKSIHVTVSMEGEVISDETYPMLNLR